MHEASLVAGLLDVVQREAAGHGMVQVTHVKMRVGQSRMVVPELMHSAFEVMSKGTVAEGAVLEIENVPLVARCSSCKKEMVVEEWVFFCPHCGSVLKEILSGEELELTELTGEPGEPI